LLGVVTKSVENPKTFGPQSHVGLSSEGKLNSWSNSAPQSTGPTPHCPALGDIPLFVLKPCSTGHLRHHFLGSLDKDGLLVSGIKQEVVDEGVQLPLARSPCKRVVAVADTCNRIN